MFWRSLLFLLAANIGIALGQTQLSRSQDINFADSAITAIHPNYNKVSGVHRWLFGENYRKEWAIPVKLPVIDINRVYGVLSLLKSGGGMQTISVRLADHAGKEWVIRSIEKVPDKLLPENLRQTFALDWVEDEYSGQHPYAPLIVPPLAVAANVPHANPVIGVLAANPKLGEFSRVYSGRVVLIEERDPAGDSENTYKMLKDIISGRSSSMDRKEVLKARMLDLLIGDWDRHEDQWRWVKSEKIKGRTYAAVPRDRDQAFHVNEGLFPAIASLSWLNPVIGDFKGNIPQVKFWLFKTRFLQPYANAQFNYEEWTRVVREFVNAETDEVLQAAISRLPPEVYQLRHQELLEILKMRRNHLPAAMDEYFRFINRIVDLRLTDQTEQIEISDGPGKGLHIVVKNSRDSLIRLNINYLPEVTKELRLYLMGGNDHVTINTETVIRLRIVDSCGGKSFNIQKAGRTIDLYGNKTPAIVSGNVNKLNLHISKDSLNSKFLPTNHYNLWMPLANAAINRDDGFLLGLGFRYTGKDGFRKQPYATVQELLVTRSFATNAFRIAYQGQWTKVIGNADFVLNAKADAPNNTMNFFGEGNATILDKNGNYQRYYRARFNLYQIDPAIRWAIGKGSVFSAGPSMQYYHLDPSENADRSILQKGIVRSYDSTSLSKDRLHLGIALNYQTDQRNNRLFASEGYLIKVELAGYTGINGYSRSFIQFKPEVTFYHKLDSSGIFVLLNRTGAMITAGNPAFYQLGYLGGQGNLLGYLQNRFAGRGMVFNNLQCRLRLANLGGYILPGQLGLSGFYDAGRVWMNNENDHRWHQGTGGGVYFAPASLTVIQVLAGHSSEGWYPYISMNFRI